jgi:hypothetical protein
MILAIVLSIKKSPTCLFRKDVLQRSTIHTELGDLYSEKVISRTVRPVDLISWEPIRLVLLNALCKGVADFPTNQAEEKGLPLSMYA